MDPSSSLVTLDESELPAGSGQLLSEYRTLIQAARGDALNPQRHLQLGRFYLRIGHRTRAYSALRAAKALQPKGAAAYRLLGQMYREDQDLEAARDTYLQLLSYEPGAAEGHLELGKVYQHLEDLPRAVTALADAVRLDPNLAEAYEILAELALASGEHERALTYLNHLKGLTPRSARVFRLTAGAHRRSGQVDRAVLDLKHALGLSPQDPEVRLELAGIYLEEGLPGQALEALEPLLGPESPTASALLAASRARQALGDVDQAEALVVRFERSFATDPAGPLARARMRRQREDLEGAEAAYRRADQLAPDDPAALLELGELLGAKGKHEKARELYLEMAARFPDNRRIPLELGRTEARRNDLSAALAAYARVLELDPAHAVALRERARIFLQDGRFDDAIRDLDKALEVDPHGSSEEADLELVREHKSFRKAFELHGEVVRALARADFQAARGQLEEILALVPDNPRWLSDLADVCRITGAYDEALRRLGDLAALDETEVAARRSRADLLYRLGRYDEAGKAYEELVDRNAEDLSSRLRVLRTLRHRLIDRSVSPDSFQALEGAYREDLADRISLPRTRLELAHLHMGMGSHLFEPKIWVSAVETHLQALETAPLSTLERIALLRARLELARLSDDKVALEAAAEEWVRAAPDDPDAAHVHLLVFEHLGRPRAGRTQAQIYARRFASDGRFPDLWLRFLNAELAGQPDTERLRAEHLRDLQREAATQPGSAAAALELGFAHLHLSAPETRLDGLSLASAAFKKAADLDGDNPWPWWGGVRTVAAGIEASRGSRAARSRALGAARAAVRRFPRDPWLLFELGRLGLGDPEDVLARKEGREALTRCLVQGPRPFAAAQVQLGRGAEAEGDRHAAYHHYLAAFEEPEGVAFDDELLTRLRALGAG